MSKIILVTGGRDFDDVRRINKALLPYRSVGNILITGAARGADSIAEATWKRWQLPYVGVPAFWDRAGRAAGQARNHQMIVGNSLAPHAHLVPDVVVAFPGGRGTAGCIEQAGEYGIEVVNG